MAVFDGHHYLSKPGMKRAANMSRVLPSVIRRRQGASLFGYEPGFLFKPNCLIPLITPSAISRQQSTKADVI